ncbi:methyltransferase domain-containing protein [Candidatus Latescibacterota bacterium]
MARKPLSRDPELIAKWFATASGFDFQYSHPLLRWLNEGTHELANQWGAAAGPCLEIGSGSGHHSQLASASRSEYVCLELQPEYAAMTQRNAPSASVVRGTAVELPFADRAFSRVVSISVFEHLRPLSRAVDEVLRVLRPGGDFVLALPAEGGFLYGLGRNLTTRRYHERQWGIDYMHILRQEHVNTCSDVRRAVQTRLLRVRERHFPFRLPTVHLNAFYIGHFRRPA